MLEVMVVLRFCGFPRGFFGVSLYTWFFFMVFCMRFLLRFFLYGYFYMVFFGGWV